MKKEKAKKLKSSHLITNKISIYFSTANVLRFPLVAREPPWQAWGSRVIYTSRKSLRPALQSTARNNEKAKTRIHLPDHRLVNAGFTTAKTRLSRLQLDQTAFSFLTNPLWIQVLARQRLSMRRPLSHSSAMKEIQTPTSPSSRVMPRR